MTLKPASHNIPCKYRFTDSLTDLAVSPPKLDLGRPDRAVALRLRELTILDSFDGIFGGSNEIKLVSVVNDGTGAEPFKFEVGAFPGINPKQPLPLGDKGLLLYYAEPSEYPKYLDWRLLVVEDDSDVRNAGLIIKEMQKSDAFKGAVASVAKMANPTVGAVIEVTNFVIGLVAGLMEQNQDDVVSLFAATYTRAFDNLGIGTHTFHQEERCRAKYEILAI